MFRKIKLLCVIPLLLTLASTQLAVARQAGGGGEPPPGERPAEALAVGEVDIRWTGDGIPHVRANDWQALGAGVGYVQAQDALCTLAEAFVTYEGRRAWFFGAEARPQHDSTLGQPTNLALDFFFRAFGDDRAVARVWAAQPPALRSLVTGYTQGYNRYLAEQSRRGKRARQRHACIGKDWVRPVVPADLYRRFHAAQLAAGYAHFIPELVDARPPGVKGRQLPADGQHRDVGSAAWPVRLAQSVGHRMALGSNMIALGDEATNGEGGVLLGNPHWYWSGPDRFYQMHLTMPGRLDVAGVGFLGVPVVMLGFNGQVAWSHTVSAARRFGLFELKLDPQDPTRYEVDGRWHPMRHRTVTVNVRDQRGRAKAVSRIFYDTRFGPLIDLSNLDPALGWGRARALAFQDVNVENFRVFPGFLRWNQASSLDEFIAIQRQEQGIPWVNTAAIGRGDGRVWYADVGTVPNVSDALRDDCHAALSAGFAGKDPKTPVLDGTRSACQWPSSPKARQPGAMPPDEMPWLLRRDYVANMNDSYWLSNVHQPLEGFARVMGGEREPLSWRSRQGHRMALSILAQGAASASVVSERLRHASLNDVVETARLFRDDWLAAACSMPAVTLSVAEHEALGLGAGAGEGLSGQAGVEASMAGVSDPARSVPLSAACAVLKRWDGRGSAGSRGALLWELAWAAMETLDSGAPEYEVPFSVADPLNTPRIRRFVPERVAKALAAASLRMLARGLALDVPLGQVRYLKAGMRRVPLFGGCHQFGYFVVGCEDDSLEPLGPNALANTYLQAVHFNRDGVVAHTLLAHGQDERVFSTGDGLAPVHRYARKDWLRFPFHDADIRRDPSMRRQVLRFARP